MVVFLPGILGNRYIFQRGCINNCSQTGNETGGQFKGLFCCEFDGCNTQLLVFEFFLLKFYLGCSILIQL
jgi:hypothetical protein